jgi:SAM-dependent methyltransferase
MGHPAPPHPEREPIGIEDATDTVRQMTLAASVRHGGLDRHEMVPFIPAPATSVLDVGCSRGRFGALLRQAAPDRRIVGIEPDSQAVTEAARHYDEVICGIFPDDMPVDATFDCIVFNDVIEHVVDPWTMLRNAARHLAPDGRIVASIPNIRYYIVVRDLLLRGRWQYADWGVLDRTHLRFFTRESIEQLFPDCGYAVEQLTPINPIKLRRAALLTTKRFRDMRYQQFAVVARQADTGV